MNNGIIILPISTNKDKVDTLYDSLSQRLKLSYVGIKDIEQLQGDIDLKANIIISNLKNNIALGNPYIFFDCDNTFPSQRRLITDIASKSNYIVYVIMLDRDDILGKLNSSTPDWSENFKDILILGTN